jgi:hypothetical protein
MEPRANPFWVCGRMPRRQISRRCATKRCGRGPVVVSPANRPFLWVRNGVRRARTAPPPRSPSISCRGGARARPRSPTRAHAHASPRSGAFRLVATAGVPPHASDLSADSLLRTVARRKSYQPPPRASHPREHRTREDRSTPPRRRVVGKRGRRQVRRPRAALRDNRVADHGRVAPARPTAGSPRVPRQPARPTRR